MLQSFEFFSAARIVFGPGRIRELGALAANLGSKVLLIFNGPLPEETVNAAAFVGVELTRHRQHGEPTVSQVDEAVAEARKAGCDLVIGLGGGSAIDSAKAVAGLLTNGGTAIDYMEVVGAGKKIYRPAAPWIAVPTTAGTGAEVTRNAVIGCPEKRFKASLRSEHLLPRIVLVDPALGVGIPPDVTARCGMDALCQLIESYASINAGPLTDALALFGIPLAARALPAACRNGGDVVARCDMALAAMLSGMTLTNAGLGAVHGFAAPLRANFPAPHGTICGCFCRMCCAPISPPRWQSTLRQGNARFHATPISLERSSRAGAFRTARQPGRWCSSQAISQLR